MKQSPLYTVIMNTPSKTSAWIMDANTGVKKILISIGSTVVEGPTVTGDRVTFICKRTPTDTSRQVRIYKIPSGSLETSYTL